MDIPIILASASPARLKLLQQIKITPTHIIPANIDESQLKKERPNHLSLRLAKEKALAVASKFTEAIIIAADTVCVSRGGVLPKAENKQDVKYCLEQLSGRRHRVYTGVYILKKSNDLLIHRQRIITSIVQFKRLSDQDIDSYCSLDEGLDKAGGYTISGYAEKFVSFISGSYSNIIGLPLYETGNMLNSLGISLHQIP